MKLQTLSFSVATLFLAVLPSARATITDVTYAPDGTGAISCPIYYWPGTDNVNVYGTQYSAPGSIDFSVTTDTPTDPTLTLGNSIVNDTGFIWTGYEVQVTMAQTFTLSAASVTVPPDWTLGSITQPGAPVAGIYTGDIIFAAGTPIQPGSPLDFSYQLSFTGSVQFTETLTPTPEPGTASLLIGGLLLGGWVSRKRRQA
jgi:hypothetical protein